MVVEQGYTVDVYPGIALPALRNMDKYNNVPLGLTKRVVLELEIVKKGSKRKNKVLQKA